jgi:hypothetical protein
MSEPTIQVVARLRTRDQRQIAHSCEFTNVEWERLDRFAKYAQELSSTVLVSTPGRLEFSISASEGQGAEFLPVEMPHPDRVRALLLLLRPFVLNDEEGR